MCKKIFIVVSFIIISFSAFADQDIEIVGGNGVGLPKIAIVSFAGDNTNSTDSASSIIANDLSITGEFNVVKYDSTDMIESDVTYTITGTVNNGKSISYKMRNNKQSNVAPLQQKINIASGSG